MLTFEKIIPEMRDWLSIEHLFHKRDSDTIKSINKEQREALLEMSHNNVLFSVLRILDGDVKYLDIRTGYPTNFPFPELEILTYVINDTYFSQKYGSKIQRKFNTDFIRAQKSLKILSLSKSITSFPNLTGLKDLRYLDLSKNNLQSVKGIGILPKLEHLYLSENDFSSLESFRNLHSRNLKILDLSKNNITELCSFESILHIKHLEMLNLSNNLICFLDKMVFPPKLRTINLANNRIKSLKQIPSVPNVLLNNNMINELNIKKRNSCLEMLNLDNNQINSIIAFKNQTSLKSLSVKNNKISVFENFKNLPSLTKLDASKNEIKKIFDLDCFPSCCHLILGYDERIDPKHHFSKYFIKLEKKHYLPFVKEGYLKIVSPPPSFHINEYLSVEFSCHPEDSDEIATVFVASKRFLKCAVLAINIPTGINLSNSSQKIQSVDELAAIFSENNAENFDRMKLSPKQIFWAHCSNLQAWAEHNYDTRLLHRNIAFPLLKELANVGDPTAKKVFKEEIASRYISGHPNVKKFLRKEGYLDCLSKEELESILKF
ncbi:MAG: hypothetical protein GF353_13550 [Candidatus Lokiarchaeota archaeon]|nr:hypothetical protein [Candidatus Lokiarchaeota archaeon]